VHGELAEIRAMIADLAGSVSELAGVASEPPSASAAGRTGRSIPPGRARAILLTLKDDSPQVIALCLSMLPPETAAAVLPGLPETMQADVVAAIAGLEPVDEALQERLMRHLARSVQQQQTLGQIGGIERTVGILNLVPRSVEKSVMTRFENDDPSLFEALAQRMFVFEDMTIVDSGAIQALAEAVGESTLALASKGAPPEVISHIAGALHDDVAESYQTQLSALGRVRRHDVERAQQSVIEELKALEQSGTVVVMRRDEVVE
jgi:flagellar motor switch protein FliG